MFFRTATARGKAEQADYAAVCANEDSTEVDNDDGDGDKDDDGNDDGNGDKDDGDDDDNDADDHNGELSRLVPALVTLLPSSSNQVRIKSK